MAGPAIVRRVARENCEISALTISATSALNDTL
jgi:hypothetical protein